jgi:hypothetical protein
METDIEFENMLQRESGFSIEESAGVSGQFPCASR